MRCAFCKQHVNEKRVTTYYTHVARKNGSWKKVRWCRSCDETKADQIDQFLRETNDVQPSPAKGPENRSL
jgi:hypothetical protein